MGGSRFERVRLPAAPYVVIVRFTARLEAVPFQNFAAGRDVRALQGVSSAVLHEANYDTRTLAPEEIAWGH